MQLESLTNLKDERILPGWHVAIGRAHKLWCDWKRSRIYDMKVFRLADMMRLEELTNFPDVSILSGWHVAIGRAHKFWCDWKSSPILMRLEALTNFIAIGSAHEFTVWKYSVWLTGCDWKSSQILMRLEELTNVDAIGSAHKFTWWKSCAVLGPRPAGWTASIPRSSRRWPAWSWGPCCRSSGPQTDRSHLGQHRWTQFIIN